MDPDSPQQDAPIEVPPSEAPVTPIVPDPVPMPDPVPVEPVAEPIAPIEEPSDPPVITIPVISQAPIAQSPIIPEQVTPEMASLFQSWLTAYQKSFRSLGTLGLKRKHQKHLDRVVELAGEHGSITRRELQLAMRLSAPTIDKYTHELVVLGRLRRVGAPSHGRYERM
jgi:hypothetical protein